MNTLVMCGVLQTWPQRFAPDSAGAAEPQIGSLDTDHQPEGWKHRVCGALYRRTCMGDPDKKLGRSVGGWMMRTDRGKEG